MAVAFAGNSTAIQEMFKRRALPGLGMGSCVAQTVFGIPRAVIAGVMP